ncbi:sterol desaturase family protein [Pelagibius sp. Alg239-R121]|uniref:sterol desaturase family protein n=1 Tax=Pelagibius sp. Alg239-R121 TaxID=2993448 RepID=UPI0024A6A5C5|nr:sterol desaturase family protein [Pelagibius sp. Alg239-R121]
MSEQLTADATSDVNRTATSAVRREKRGSKWNYRPDLPLQVSPMFQWPVRPLAIFSWIWKSWFPVSERLIIVGLAAISWFYLHPALEDCRDLAFGWIAQIWARNLGLMFLVAGGLHLYFFVFRKQGDVRRYDARALKTDNNSFTFKNQVLDNMFWSCASGVTIWSAYEVLMMWGMANGYVPTLAWSESPVWFVLLFLLVPLWESFYFYWVHRFLHWPPLYRIAHALHHRNTNVGPWSGMSMHPIEHVLYLGTVLIHWVVAAHPLHIIYHLQYFTLTAATTHTGFEGLVVKDKNRLSLGTFHHQMHHRYFECNYGGLEMPWDKWFGSFHDGTSEAHERLRGRRRRALGEA